MRRRRIRSWTIWIGAVLSALVHGGLIALAATGPAWLRPGDDAAASPVVSVALISAQDFAALAARPAPAPAPPEPPAATASASTAPADPVDPASGGTGVALTEPEPEAATEDLPSLAPAGAPEAPFGVGAVLGQAAAPAPLAPADAATAFRKAVTGAVRLTFEEPDGIEAGPARLSLLITRDGRLLTARLVQSSGDAARDSAAIAAVRSAHLPVIPQAMPELRVTVEVSLPEG